MLQQDVKSLQRRTSARKSYNAMARMKPKHKKKVNSAPSSGEVKCGKAAPSRSLKRPAAAMTGTKKKTSTPPMPLASNSNLAESKGTYSATEKVPNWTEVSVKVAVPGTRIHVETECSGLESVMVAMKQMGLGGAAKLRFCTEIDEHAQKMILSHSTPDILYKDIKQRPVEEMPTCDIYVVGFPCQPYSGVGLNQGTKDVKGRGKIFPHLLDYINQKQPKAFVLENVKGLTNKKHKKTFMNILTALEKSKNYIVMWKILNTRSFGLPQSRPRVYIVGLRRNTLMLKANTPCFKWPEPYPCEPLSAILEDLPADPLPQKGSLKRTNLKCLLNKIEKRCITKQCVLDINASQSRATYQVSVVPCLTRARAGSGGFWLSKPGRMLSTKEMLRLQGLPDDFADLRVAAGISETQLRLMIGNSMSVNVLVHVLRAVLQAIRLCVDNEVLEESTDESETLRFGG